MAETYCEEREGCAIHCPEPLAQLVEHRPFKPRVVGSIPTRLTLQDLVLAWKILGALRRRKRPSRVCQQTVSKRSRFFGPDAAHGVAQILERQVSVGAGRGRHRRVPENALHATGIVAALRPRASRCAVFRGSCSGGKNARSAPPDPRAPAPVEAPSRDRTQATASSHRARGIRSQTDSHRSPYAGTRPAPPKWGPCPRARPWWFRR